MSRNPSSAHAVPDADEAAPADLPATAGESPEAAYEERPGRFVVIVAHPDDADFGPAGTIAKWIAEGSAGHLVCCTSGDQGADDPATDPLELARLREAEQRAAASVIGYSDVTFLHQPDGALENDLALREQLVRILRTVRPDAVMAIDPTVFWFENGFVQHTDHRAAGAAALDAVYPAARNPMAFRDLLRDGLEPHDVPTVYLFWSERPNAWVDVTATIDRKLAALREHVSQLRKPDELEERVRTRAAEAGERIGRPAAEALRVIRLG
jgi:LmbE family N-acetylglucosaminyl deacetylase